MTRLLVLLVVLALTTPASAVIATRYATSTARGGLSTGACLTTATRCTVAYAISLSSAGDTVSLESNTINNPYIYQGANDVIAPSTGRSGVTVKAEVDGGVIIDGQFTRKAVDLYEGNNYWTLAGFNVKNGTNSLISIRGSSNTVRRVVGWDIIFSAEANGAHLFSCSAPGINNLFEDVAGFGTGTWIFTHSQNKLGACTFRRAWGRFEGTSRGSNGGTAFGGLFYKARSSTCENCIGEYGPNIGLTSYTVTHPNTSLTTVTDGAPPIPNGPINQNRWFDDGDTTCATDQALCNMDGYVAGSLFYVQATANMARFTIDVEPGVALMYTGTGRIGGQMTFKDVLWFAQPSHPQFANIRALNLSERLFSTDMFLTNVSTVAGAANVIDSVDSSGNGTSGVWVTTNLVHASGLAGLNAANANPWTGTTGANLCYRYVNRVRQDGTGGTTVQPLWPWPMNARIKAATASAGAYSGPCQDCMGTFPTRTETDVTAIIEELLGTIPAACRQSTPPSGPQGLKLTRPVEARSLLTKILYAPTR